MNYQLLVVMMEIQNPDVLFLTLSLRLFWYHWYQFHILLPVQNSVNLFKAWKKDHFTLGDPFFDYIKIVVIRN